MALTSASHTGKQRTEEDHYGTAVTAAYIAADVVVTAAHVAADVVVTNAAVSDLDAHFAGPPTGGAMSVAQLDVVDKWATDKTVLGGAATPVVVHRLGSTATEGYETAVLDETVDCITTPAASFPLTSTIPAGAVILAVQATLRDIMTADTAVKVGIGVTADPDKYGKTGGLSANEKVDTIPTHAVLGATETIAIFAVDTAGDAAGTIGGGVAGTERVRVRIVYAVLNSLDN